MGGFSFRLDFLEHVGGDVAGRVDAVETGAAEMANLGVSGPDCFLQVVDGLVDDLVGADFPGDLARVGVTGDEFRARLHVDPVDAGIAEGWRVGGEIDLICPAFPDKLNDGPGGVAADDAVVDEEDVLSFYANAHRGKVKKASLALSSLRIVEEELQPIPSKGWAEMIRKVYEVDPMLCPRCGGQMRIISFLTDYAVVDRIINHLKLTFVAERPPPPHVAYQEVLMAAESSAEYFS